MSYVQAPEAKTPVVVQGREVGAFSNALSAPPPTESPLRKTNRGCRDVLFSILFYCHLVAVGYAGVVYAPIAAQDTAGGGERRLVSISSLPQRWLQEGQDNNNNNNDEMDMEIDPNALLSVLIVAGILSFVFASLALGFMMRNAEVLVKMALWFNIIFLAVMAVVSLMGAALPMGLMFLVFAAFSAYYAYRVWPRIPFAASNLVTAVSAVQANLGLAFYAYWSVVVLFLWSIAWMVAASSTIYVTGNCNAEGECESVNGFLIFLFLLSYYWTAQGASRMEPNIFRLSSRYTTLTLIYFHYICSFSTVISNVVHVTTAGTVGSWWFVPHEANGCCSQAVRDSYVRSLTTSFGSICLGSLIVALLKAIREMVHSLREADDSILACIADCLLGCIGE